MKICLLGQGHEICEIARRYVRAGHIIGAILTYPRAMHLKDAYEHKVEEQYGVYESVFTFSEQNGISLKEVENINTDEMVQWLKAQNFDLYISFRFRQIIGREVLEVCGQRVFNIHIGDLPFYRGSGAMSWMILNGERKSAICLHRMEPAVDAGDIVYRRPFDIPVRAMPINIYKVCSPLIVESAVEALALYQQGKLTALDRRLGVGTYFPRLRASEHGHINFGYTPDEFERFCLAFGKPYSGAYGLQREQRIHFIRVGPAEAEGTYHPYCNGLVISIDAAVGCARLVTGTGSVNVFTLRDRDDEVPATSALKPGMRLV